MCCLVGPPHHILCQNHCFTSHSCWQEKFWVRSAKPWEPAINSPSGSFAVFPPDPKSYLLLACDLTAPMNVSRILFVLGKSAVQQPQSNGRPGGKKKKPNRNSRIAGTFPILHILFGWLQLILNVVVFFGARSCGQPLLQSHEAHPGDRVR